MIRKELDSALENFRSNAGKIQDLLSFDSLLLGMAIASLKRVRDAQNMAGKAFENPKHRVDAVIEKLENVHKNDSLTLHYNTIYNQALVLLVSHFSAALRDAYRATVDLAIRSKGRERLLAEEIKVTVADLVKDDDDISMRIADILIEKKDLSFQDMKGIGRAFEELSGFRIQKSECIHDIITAQACRHAIVHAGELATAQTIRQLSIIKPRRLKADLTVGERIQFSPDEVKGVALEMEQYLHSLLEGISGSLETVPENP